MGYRQVVIKSCDTLKLKDNQLIVVREEVENKVPLEDINFILLEDNKTVITAKLLSELGKQAISLIICDDKFEPSIIMYPYNHHYKQLTNLELQLENTKIISEALWQTIIKKKIENSIKVIEITTKDEYTLEKLRNFYKEVEPNDETNREGLAAKMYFRSIFDTDFIRFKDDAINGALNYGYTIIKSSIVRTLAVYGLNSYLGIKHKSKTNNFNLAYDLIEPYRCFVDYYVYKNFNSLIYPLSFNTRTDLVDILNTTVIVDKKKYSLEYSIELLIKSYIKSLESGSIELELPDFIYD